MRVEMIPVGLIQANPNSLRTVEKDAEEYQELKQSMSEIGLEASISVVETEFEDPENPDQKIKGFTLVDGLQRTSIAQELGWAEIPAIIKEREASDQILAQVVANGTRIPTKPAAFSRQLRSWMDMNPLATYQELSTRLGWTNERLQKSLGLLRLPEILRKRVDNGKIKLSNAFALSGLSSPDLMEQFATDASEQSTEDFKETIAAFKKKERENKRGGEPTVETFEAVPTLMVRNDLLDEIGNHTRMVSALEKAGAKTAEEGYKVACQVLTRMDVDGVAQQEAAWNERKKKTEEKAEIRAQAAKDKEKKKLEERQKDAAEKLAALRSGEEAG